jgi:hypothetical protein
MQIPTATRPNGQALFDQLNSALSQNVSDVIIDFADLSPTPSFVDQSIGSLVKTLGFENFKMRVKLINVSDEVKPLIKHVVLTRAAQSKAAANDRIEK